MLRRFMRLNCALSFKKKMLLHAAFPVLTANKKLKKSFLSFLVFSTEISPTKRKRRHKVTASSDEEDDSCRPGARVNVRPRGGGGEMKVKVKVYKEKDFYAEMGKCSESTPVVLTKDDVCNLNPFPQRSLQR
jgi:hypothetical protein